MRTDLIESHTTMRKCSAVLASYAGVLAYSAFIFLGAWRLLYWQGILYVCVALAGVTMNHLLARRDSDIAVERVSRVGAGETWDKRILAGYFLASVVAFVVAGLDSGRFGWSGRVPLPVTCGGVALMLLGQLLFALARRENEFFTSTAAIQSGRGHRVCETGPYRFVRHPGYLGMLMSLLAFPLVLQSFWAFIPVSAGALLLVVRTRLEDRFLLERLAGYARYATGTRWRLIPWVF